jgi:hypothetical protein
MSGWTKHPAGVTSLPMNEILPARAVIDGNVYQSTGQLFQVWSGPEKPGAMTASSVLALQTTLGGGYYHMTRPEWHAQSGSGWTDSGGKATAALAAKHGWAMPSPADSRLVADLPAGSRHYGAFWG